MSLLFLPVALAKPLSSLAIRSGRLTDNTFRIYFTSCTTIHYIDNFGVQVKNCLRALKNAVLPLREVIRSVYPRGHVWQNAWIDMVAQRSQRDCRAPCGSSQWQRGFMQRSLVDNKYSSALSITVNSIEEEFLFHIYWKKQYFIEYSLIICNI